MKLNIEVLIGQQFEEVDPGVFIASIEDIEEFTKLIIERCAAECDSVWDGDSDTYTYSTACNDCAGNIRYLKETE